MSARRGLRPWCLLLAGWPAVVAAQVPAGPEFRVNTYTTGSQAGPGVAMDGAGNFVVAWRDDDDGSYRGIFARRFTAAGAPLGAQFRVNAYTTDDQQDPAVAVDARGNMVVVWSSRDQDGSSWGVFARRYDPAGIPLATEFRVNSYTTGYQSVPSLAVTAGGRFVVVWLSDGQDGSSSGVFAQRFDAAAQPLGAELRVNTYTTGVQRTPSVAADRTGRFVVCWSSIGPDGGYADVFAQRFDAAGAPAGSEFRVNAFTTGGQYETQIAASADGDFVVAWAGPDDGFSAGIFARRFAADGTPRGLDFRVNTYTTDFQGISAIAVDAAANFVVTWASNAGGEDLFGQRFDAAGSPRGAEFRVNTDTTDRAAYPSAVTDAAGNFIVSWGRTIGEGDGDVFVQRFGGLGPVALAVDGSGNAVWEPGESVEMKPTWHNFNGSTQTFGGVLSNLTGPAGATYSIGDNSAVYGTVLNGVSAQCSDCYAVSVTNPPQRPVLHWDASALETITPDAHGQVKGWTLHVGGSFTDVPMGNPFYRFVETLLHKGITGGCGAGTYCPGNATTREQMSVFVLLAKEGAGYAPPACTTPIFNDVPAGNPFCRFIEELARRNVVSGCGNGNYCPGNPVTREQMAVFVLRTLDPALDPPACMAGSELFADVPASSGFCKWIEELARRQVVGGCGGGNYCPVASVTREQMGVFLGVTFGLTLY